MMKCDARHTLSVKMKRHSISFFVICQFIVLASEAQQLQKEQRGYSFWNMRDAVFQLGFNAIDDDNSRMKRMLDISKWSIPVAPSRFTMCKNLYDNYYLDIAIGAARLKRFTPDSWYVNPLLYLNLDFNFRYYWNIIGADSKGSPSSSFTGRLRFWENMAVDIYPAIGVGYQYLSQIGTKSMPTFNLGGGLDWWIKKNVLAINFQSIARFALHLAPPISSGNLLHYTAGICWKYNPKLFANLFTIKPRAKYKKKRNA